MDINELNKFVVQGSVDTELIREQDEELNPKINLKKEPQMIDLNNAIRTVLAEALLKENQYAASFPPTPTKPAEDKTDPKVKNSLALIRVIQDNLWKMSNSAYGEGELDNDITDLISSLNSPIIKLAVAKLYHIWYSEIPVAKVEEPKIDGTEEVKVEIGDQVISPQGTEYKVESISSDTVTLMNGKTMSHITEDDIKNWRKK